jgi:hypothetical protein
MAKFGNRRFKKSAVSAHTEIRHGHTVRVIAEKIKGQKLRDRMETVEVFVPTPRLRNIPGVWVGTWKAV